MGTTANNSWPYPESSDYVADGATAIENLADAIDSGLGDVDLLSRGFVGNDERTTNKGLTTTESDIVSTTVDLVSGRKYFLQFSGFTYATSTNMVVSARIYVDGSEVNGIGISCNATDDNANMTFSRIITSSVTGSVIIKATGYTSTGTTFIRGVFPSVANLICIDVGE